MHWLLPMKRLGDERLVAYIVPTEYEKLFAGNNQDLFSSFNTLKRVKERT